MASMPSYRFGFVFPMASGHINPSLPLARALVKSGHAVHYLCREQMREAIEDTGSTFHLDIEQQAELYDGREPDLFGAIEAMKAEYGLESDPMIVSMCKLRIINIELMIPGTIRWLQAINANVVVFCPLMNFEAAYSANVLGIPSVGILTTAGPGSCTRALEEFLAMSQVTANELCQALEAFEPNCAAVRNLREKYGLTVDPAMGFMPLGKTDTFIESSCTLVTTCQDLQDPLTPELEHIYAKGGAVFEAVGPLLDQEGAVRAAGHKYEATEGTDLPQASGHEQSAKEAVALVRQARAAGRRTILLSMGTVITGDHPMMGWKGRLADKQGNPRGLTGRELCQAAWSGAFDVFGESTAEAGPLIVVALGPQADALEGLTVPANAVCMPVLPQVDVLRAGIDLFVTHGGQNSFTEAISTGTPVVVCPGFGDQPVNGKKAAALGVGLQVPRPDPEAGAEAEAVKQYRSDVAEAVRRVVSERSFLKEMSRCAERMQQAGGVPRAVEVLLEVASCSSTAAPSVKLEAEKGRCEHSLSSVGGA